MTESSFRIFKGWLHFLLTIDVDAETVWFGPLGYWEMPHQTLTASVVISLNLAAKEIGRPKLYLPLFPLAFAD
jgi:hypothetical protein